MSTGKILLPLALAGAIGVPYVMDKGWPAAATQAVAGWFGQRASQGLPPALQSEQYNSEYGYGPQGETPRVNAGGFVTGPPVSSFGEVFRFDISPTWITSRWPRVTTTLSEAGLSGLRVPLVTGTAVTDLAGTMTYYFDRYQQLQRLAFDGYTGDAGKLLELLTQHYGLQPEPTLDAAMYVARWNATPTSVARISRAPVMSSDSPHSQLHVSLELNRPSVYFGLSPAFKQYVESAQATRRW